MPNAAWRKVSPTHQRLQTTVGSGFVNGSRLPVKPATTNARAIAKAQRLGTCAPPSRHSDKTPADPLERFQASYGNQCHHHERERHHQRTADDI